jgi:hypothetical protein
MSKAKTGMLLTLLLACTTVLSGSLMAGQMSRADRQTEEPAIDVVHYEIDAELELDRSYIHGHALVTFQVLETAASIPFNISRHLTVTDVTDSEGKRLPLT